MTEANRNLLLRLASAAVLVPILLLAVLWRRHEAWIAGVNLAVVIALVELYWITLRDDPVWMRVAGVAGGLLVSGTMAWCPRVDALVAALLVVTLLGAILHLVRFGELSSAASRTALMLFGQLYLPLLLTPIALMKRFPEGSDWIVLTLTLTFFGDTGAYAAGRLFGRHKLYPGISPGKTLEGAVGGLLASLGAGVLAKLWYMPQLGWKHVVLITIPGGALAMCGDLVESMIKRAYGVKDSGKIIPGHGGLLDRIDALLFATPYVYLYATYVLRIGPSARG
jgi:phosphatidate cytidylyltransferase